MSSYEQTKEIKELTDEELVTRSKDGITIAYDELVIRHSRKLTATLYQMTSNYDDAFDIAQEAFAKAYRSLKFFNGQSAFYTWLHSIALNHARNFLKRRNKRMTYSMDDDEYGNHADKDIHLADESQEADPEKSIQMSELNIKLKDALSKLSKKHRDIVIMHDVNGLSHTEISTVLNISEGTLRSRLHYAHKQLQALLSDYLN